MSEELSELQKRLNAEAVVKAVKTTGRALEHMASQLSAGGCFDRKQFKIAIDAEMRKAIVAANPDKTSKELGEELGVHHSTIDRDRNAADAATEDNKINNLDDAYAPLPLKPEPDEGLKRNFLKTCRQAISGARYDGPCDREVIATARRVASAWSKLVNDLGGSNG